MNVKLDLAKACPPRIQNWIEAVSRSRNTIPEFVLLGAIPTVAALMGPSSTVKVRSTYSEPINIYSVILSPPGAGKSQAFDLTVTSPLAALDEPPPNIVVGDHTRSGLTRHLANNHGVAIIASDELSSYLDTLSKKKKEPLEERALLNMLYDRRDEMGTYTYEYGNCSLQIKESRVCMAGYSQDEEFAKQFASLYERKDGFLDRLLFAVPEPRLLTNKEVDEWASKLSQFAIADFAEVYQEIWEIHMMDNTFVPVYSLSADAKKEYTLYADEIIRKLNCQFSASTSGQELEEVSSKDARTVLRLAGALHVLYEVLEKALTQVDWRQGNQTITSEISLSTVKYAIIFTDYFKSQRNVFVEATKGNLQPQILSGPSLKSKIIP